MNEAKQYLTVTPLGALHAVTESGNNVAKNVLCKLLQLPLSPELAESELCDLVGVRSLSVAKAVLYQLQVMHYVQAEPAPVAIASYNLSEDLPKLLAELSSTGHALLADGHGFQMGVAGFLDEVVDELSVISSQVTTLHKRYSNFLSGSLHQKHNGFGIIDSLGVNQLGFWSLNIQGTLFTLAIGGLPRLNRRIFRDLIWVLTNRYNGIQ